MTTGETVEVTWDNAQDTLDAWQAEAYYAPGAAERLIDAYGGKGSTLQVSTVPATRNGNTSNRDDFCESLRYAYGACINLRQSKAVDPKLFDLAQRGEGRK